MNFLASWFGTPTEKKREQYRALYNDLNHLLIEFNTNLKTMESKVDEYEANRVIMSDSYIPEDVFNTSESSVKAKVTNVRNQQVADAKKLSIAVDSAYQRYQHYAYLAEQERIEREAQARRQEAIRREAARRNRRT